MSLYNITPVKCCIKDSNMYCYIIALRRTKELTYEAFEQWQDIRFCSISTSCTVIVEDKTACKLTPEPTEEERT